jgi:hypothetical protein
VRQIVGVRELTVAMLRAGKTPGPIAQDRSRTLATVFDYLDQLVGRGTIRRSDILNSKSQ